MVSENGRDGCCFRRTHGQISVDHVDVGLIDHIISVDCAEKHAGQKADDVISVDGVNRLE